LISGFEEVHEDAAFTFFSGHRNTKPFRALCGLEADGRAEVAGAIE